MLGYDEVGFLLLNINCQSIFKFWDLILRIVAALTRWRASPHCLKGALRVVYQLQCSTAKKMELKTKAGRR